MGILNRGMFVLVLSAFSAECIELLIKMVLARELGNHGLGQYMSILPFVFLIFLLSRLELPVSISKLIAEKEEQYHRNILLHGINLALIITILLVIACTLTLPFLPMFDVYHSFTRWLFLIVIPILSFSAVAKGYFMGKHQMGKIAISNILKHTVQLGALFFLFRLFHFQPKTALLVSFGALLGSEVIVFAYLMSAFAISYQVVKRKPSKNLEGESVQKELMKVSVPVTAMRIFYGVISAIQPFIMKTALVHSGLTQNEAIAEFGKLTGIAMAIGFFPAFIGHSLLIGIIPTVSKAYSQKDYSTLQRLLGQVIKATFFYGLPAVTCCYFFARPLTKTFFHTEDASVYVQLLWPFFLFHYFIIPMQAYLIGLGLMKDALIHTIWATAVSFVLIYSLGSMPQWRMDGISIGLNTEAILLTSLHFLTIIKKIGFKFNTVPEFSD
ncbi:MAG: oligosaccharide flippase family protein [Bacillota bacterium]|nr:oligosaccharide flippase family protein [Bacillota bacterium]